MSPRDDSPTTSEREPPAVLEGEQQQQQQQHTANNRRRRSSSRGEDGRRRSSKRIKVFEGLTDAERRQVRHEQRQLQERLQTDSSLDDVREENNKIFKSKVRFTREAVLDIDNCNALATKYLQQVEQNVQVPRYDPLRLVAALKQKCSATIRGESFLDWTALGREAGICFNALPDRCAFAAGRWDNPAAAKTPKKRAPREKRYEDNAKEERPEEQVAQQQQQQQGRKHKESAAEANIKNIKKKLQKRLDQECPNYKDVEDFDQLKVPGVQFLFNPQSFTQTVENIFYYSFLVKKGQGAIGIDQTNGGLYVRPAVGQESNSDKQAVCRLTMRDWRRICQSHFPSNNDSGDLPHRTPPAHSVTPSPR